MGIGATSSTNEYLRAQIAAGYFGTAGSAGIQRGGSTPVRTTGIEPTGTTVDKAKFGAVVGKYAAGGVETPAAVTAPREISPAQRVDSNFFMKNLKAMQGNYSNAQAYRGTAAVDGYFSQKQQVSDDYAQYDALRNFKFNNV